MTNHSNKISQQFMVTLCSNTDQPDVFWIATKRPNFHNPELLSPKTTLEKSCGILSALGMTKEQIADAKSKITDKLETISVGFTSLSSTKILNLEMGFELR